MNSLTKNLFSTLKDRPRQATPFYGKTKPVKPRNFDSVFENSWVQSSRSSVSGQFHSRNGSNLTSLVNNQMIGGGAIRALGNGQDFQSKQVFY